MTTDSDDIDILILTPLKEYLMDQSGGGDNSKVQKEFAKSVNDIYHDEKGLYYFVFVVVNGSKRIIVLEDATIIPIQVILKKKVLANIR
mgnify:CR=1 FL=1